MSMMPTQTAARLTLTSPWFLVGIFLFIVSRLSEIHANLPLADVFLPLMILFIVFASPDVRQRIWQGPGLLLFSLLAVWCFVSNFLNDLPAQMQMRQMFAIVTLFLPLVFLPLIPERRQIEFFVVGAILASGIMFAGESMLAFAMQGYFPRELRGSQLTPVVPLAVAWVFRDKMPRLVFWLLIGTAVFSAFMSVAIQARGPLLSLPLALLVGLCWKVTRKSVLVLMAMLFVMLTAHFWMGLGGGALDTVMYSGSDTISNMERAYAIDFAIENMFHYPWTGISIQNYALHFSDNFAFFARLIRPDVMIYSPHNTFLEYSVFFGVPVGILVVLIIMNFFRVAVSTRTISVITVALVVAGVIRICAFYGLSGWLRIEWFALMVMLFHTYRVLPPHSLKPDTER